MDEEGWVSSSEINEDFSIGVHGRRVGDDGDGRRGKQSRGRKYQGLVQEEAHDGDESEVDIK